MADSSGQIAAEGEALWRFALALYARPGVAPALLALQDEAGSDVNLCLFALWLGAARERTIDGAGLAAATEAIAPLANMVGELRGQRRRLTGGADPGGPVLRQRLLAVELTVERAILGRLAEAVVPGAPAGDRLAAATANLARALGAAAARPEAAVLRAALAALLRRD